MNYKILMVDDDRELLKMLNQYFTLKNYTVIIAENGIEAMEKISANPDIILLDVNMPGMDGIDLVKNALKVKRDIYFVQKNQRYGFMPDYFFDGKGRGTGSSYGIAVRR